MYQYCREVGITLFTVSHRRSLWKHHEVCQLKALRGRPEFSLSPPLARPLIERAPRLVPPFLSLSLSRLLFCSHFISFVPLQFYLHMDGRGSYEFKPIDPDTIEFGS